MIRKVRTPEGAKFYGAPIGSPIVKDKVTGKLKALDTSQLKRYAVPEGRVTEMQTTKIQVSKDKKFFRATCSCGWKGTARQSRKLAKYDADGHTARHASRRSKEQIAADRTALLDSIGTDWKEVPFGARESDVKALIKSGAVESQVKERLDSRPWLLKGKLARKVRYVRRAAQSPAEGDVLKMQTEKSGEGKSEWTQDDWAQLAVRASEGDPEAQAEWDRRENIGRTPQMRKAMELGGRQWKSADGTKQRVYLDAPDWLQAIGVDVTTDGLGRVKWIDYPGLSNAQSQEIARAKVWVDADGLQTQQPPANDKRWKKVQGVFDEMLEALEKVLQEG